MPDKRTHRGPHPEDSELFADKNIPILRAATSDHCLLLSKGYAQKSSLKLVGDRFSLTQRQRLAVMRSACSDEQLAMRGANEFAFSKLTSRQIAIDGYNVLITIEAALSGAMIFIGRDGCCRDLAGIHGSYRKVKETIPAIELIADCLCGIGIEKALWFFDSPVSNSGQLKTMIRQLADKNNWLWQVELLTNPDIALEQTDLIAATSDSIVLDKCRQWMNLAAEIIKKHIPTAKIIDLSRP